MLTVQSSAKAGPHPEAPEASAVQEEDRSEMLAPVVSSMSQQQAKSSC